ASDAGPRTSLSPNTSTSNSPPSFEMRSMSLMRTSRAAFATCPFDRILPKSQLFLAKVRVLKNRAAHSQASIRITVISQSYLALVSAKNRAVITVCEGRRRATADGGAARPVIAVHEQQAP